MTSLKAILMQIKAIYFQPYFHMYISALQLVRNIGIAVFAGIAIFALLRRLNIINSSSFFSHSDAYLLFQI